MRFQILEHNSNKILNKIKVPITYNRTGAKRTNGKIPAYKPREWERDSNKETHDSQTGE